MAITQRDIANQMIRQLRILDPSVSAEIGTPERKIIDTVAQALADSQLDLTVLSSGLDIDSKFGEDLDRFLATFSFARQKGASATGVITLTRETPSTIDTVIPDGTLVSAPSVDTSPTESSGPAIFQTTHTVTLRAGDTEVSVPVQSINIGANNNVAANTIVEFVGQPVLGVTGITNPVPTTGGRNAETDEELKARFRNTVFRNLAGTSDQFLALAVAGALTNKANVIGPISRYREYIQVPAVDDSSEHTLSDADGSPLTVHGNGNAGEYTSALSTIPYSEHTYTTVPVHISNGEIGPGATFYTEVVDFEMNVEDDARNRGDAYRLAEANRDPSPVDAPFRPNVTFYSVYEGSAESVQAIRPNDVVLFEHSYVSSASRNDYERSITNCVDVYINGTNATQAQSVIPLPVTGVYEFVDDPNHRFYFENYRRLGEPEHRPVLGNLFSPLFWNPLESLPEVLIVDDFIYELGEHYWAIVDVSEHGGTVRARTGIEWSKDATPIAGPHITLNEAPAIEVDGYAFDKNVIDIQTALEGSKQVTTDVLVHKAVMRYLKFDITVMYDAGASVAETNQEIHDSLQAFLTGLYFGNAIQLSDVLAQIHNVPGVDNVRWSHDLNSNLSRITETDAFGVPRLGGISDRFITGATSIEEVQQWYIVGNPTGGTYVVHHNGVNSNPIDFDADLAAIETALAPLNAVIDPSSVAGSGTPSDPYKVTFLTDGLQDDLIVIVPSLSGGDTTYNNDFVLGDDELASLPRDATANDTLPGLRIRPRAQHTWQRG